MVLCPTKCVVASHLFKSANTGASASRECSSCEGVGPLAFIYTTKWVSAVKRDIWTFRIATIRAVRIGLDELSNREAIGGFGGRDGDVLAHLSSQDSRMARVSTNASMPYRPYSRPTPEYLNPPQGACGSSVMPLITTRPARICEATRRARWRSVPRTAAWRPYLESFAIRIASSSES